VAGSYTSALASTSSSPYKTPPLYPTSPGDENPAVTEPRRCVSRPPDVQRRGRRPCVPCRVVQLGTRLHPLLRAHP
jgi:hypothetical protein